MSTESFDAFLHRLPSGSARPSPEGTWHQRARGQLTLGERSADRLRNVMGSWGFVGGFLVFMAGWWLLNSVKTTTWDPYPFILLNLFLSMLAGLQCAILLIAAKRQDSISEALAQHDFDTNVAAKVDIEALLEINRRQLEMIAELQGIARAVLPAQTRRDLEVQEVDAQRVEERVSEAHAEVRTIEEQLMEQSESASLDADPPEAS
ncbi:DUF1003 domain-containing protein [Microbacterium sp. 22242]|uniref:DUF1003 domain-containing protein n=1 Tax=Microbacterium sp. 22242 TaxID=3453896 RepID=UPI003F83F249